MRTPFLDITNPKAVRYREYIFVRRTCFLGRNAHNKYFKTTFKEDMNKDARPPLNIETSRSFHKPAGDLTADKVIKHFRDELMKGFKTS